jgi:catechol 2,3-dioxygenase
MIKPKLHHVTIKTSHLDEMIAWYGIVIGAQVQFRDQVAAGPPTTRPITG